MLTQNGVPPPRSARTDFLKVFQACCRDRSAHGHRVPRLPILLLASIAVFPRDAFAYIDPNTGGYVFQVLFPVISVIIAWYVFFRDKLRKVVGSIVSRISGRRP